MQVTARIVRHFPPPVHAKISAANGTRCDRSNDREKEDQMNLKPAKYRVGHGGYVSEFEQFFDNFIAKHPEVDEDRRRAWYIWWDHRIDLKDLEKQHEDTVPAKPYQYD
jgi:hypothetical protein